MLSPEPAISLRATSIARGLLRTERVVGIISLERGMLRLRCRGVANYWIEINGGQVFRGKTFLKADELRPKFTEAMEHAGRRDLDRRPGGIAHRAGSNFPSVQ
jgi:hypothetical protein